MSGKISLPNFAGPLEALYNRANKLTAGWLAVARQAVEGYASAHGSQASASMAYYTLFSMFPLLLALTITMSLFVDVESAQAVLLSVLDELLPNSTVLDQFIVDIVNSVAANRTEIGILSVLALFWSASSAFTTLTYNIDLAWSRERLPNPVKARLIGLLMIGVIYVFLLLALIAIPLLGALAARPTPILTAVGVDISWLWSWAPRVIAVTVTLLALLAIYHWVPRRRVSWRAALGAAVPTTLALQVLNAGFGWYLSSRMARYELIYGSLTSIIVLMLWVYFSVTIIFMGAHLCASISQRLDAPAE
jgi:membrane protein